MSTDTLDRLRDLQVWLLKDAEDNRPECETFRWATDCHKQAVWVCINDCCGKRSCYCDEHAQAEREMQERLWEQFTTSSREVTCNTCGSKMTGPSRWEPLRP